MVFASKRANFAIKQSSESSSLRNRTASDRSFFLSAYTGYIDIEARHLFFYFFESRNDPDKDDVIFWTNGGYLQYTHIRILTSEI
jgi:carboxypeptidase C (cathepsin A)